MYDDELVQVSNDDWGRRESMNTRYPSFWRRKKMLRSEEWWVKSSTWPGQSKRT